MSDTLTPTDSVPAILRPHRETIIRGIAVIVQRKKPIEVVASTPIGVAAEAAGDEDFFMELEEALVGSNVVEIDGVLTVGDLADRIVARYEVLQWDRGREGLESNDHPSRAVFFALREMVLPHRWPPHVPIRPSTRLDEILLTEHDQDRFARNVAVRFGVCPPRHLRLFGRLPMWATWRLLSLFGLGGLLGAFGWDSRVVVGGVCMLVAVLPMNWLSSWQWPSELRTFADMSFWILGQRPKALREIRKSLREVPKA